MITDRVVAIFRYCLLLALLLLLLLVTSSGWAMGLMVTVLLIPPVSLAGNIYVRKHIHGRIQAPTTSVKGKPCVCTVRLKNSAWLPAAKLCCRLGMINDLTGEENTTEFIVGLGPGKSASRELWLESQCCGRVYIHMQSVKIADYFGLFSLNVPMKAATRITMLPELFTCDVLPSMVSSISDDSAVSQRGDDRTETFQLREYQSGDDIRQIHWKLSSKLDNLILREPSQNVSRSLLVFWDKRYDALPEKMDAMAEVTASICRSLCDSGTAFDLCWAEKEELELRQITALEVLLSSIPALVTQKGFLSCPDPDTQSYGRVICITTRIPETTDKDKYVYLICSEKEMGGEKEIVFSPANYMERLERLEL